MEEFDELFGGINAKQVMAMLTGSNIQDLDLEEAAQTSMAIVEYDTEDEDLISNSAFIKSWGIARVKAIENLKLITALLILKKKYKVSQFDFQLLLENFDEENLL